MTMDRDEIRDEFSPLLDGELAPDERAELEQKLAEDAGLLRELDALRKVDKLYRQLPPEQAPDRLEERVRGALQPGIVRFTRRRLGRRTLWPVAAAAAMFVVFAGVLVTQFDGPFPGQMQLASAPDAAEPELAEKTVAEDLARRSHARGRQGEPLPPPPARAPAAAPPQEAGADHTFNGYAVSGVAEESAPQTVAEGAAVVAQATVPEEEAVVADRVTEKHEMASAESIEKVRGLAKEPAKPDAETEEQWAALLGAKLADVVDLEAKGKPEIKKIGDQEFRLRTLGKPVRASRGRVDEDFFSGERVWFQEGYKDEKPLKLERGSEELARLLAKHKELEKLLELGGLVVFRIDMQWYQIVPKPKGGDQKADGQP